MAEGNTTAGGHQDWRFDTAGGGFQERKRTPRHITRKQEITGGSSHEHIIPAHNRERVKLGGRSGLVS